jgi:hypothetical protein
MVCEVGGGKLKSTARKEATVHMSQKRMKRALADLNIIGSPLGEAFAALVILRFALGYERNDEYHPTVYEPERLPEIVSQIPAPFRAGAKECLIDAGIFEAPADAAFTAARAVDMEPVESEEEDADEDDADEGDYDAAARGDIRPTIADKVGGGDGRGDDDDGLIPPQAHSGRMLRKRKAPTSEANVHGNEATSSGAAGGSKGEGQALKQAQLGETGGRIIRGRDGK